MKRFLKVTIPILSLLLILLIGYQVYQAINTSKALEQTRWGLKYYIIDGVQSSELVGDQWVQFEEFSFSSYDGCNQNVGEYSVRKQGDFDIYYFGQTLVGCFVFDEITNETSSMGDKEFHDALVSAVAFEIKNGDLWLYSTESKKDVMVLGTLPYVEPAGGIPPCRSGSWLCNQLRELRNRFSID